VNDERRFLELAELYLDDDLSPTDTSELRGLLEGDPALIQRLHALMRDQVICRTALRPADPQVIGERTRRMLDSWRPQSGEIAAQAVFARVDHHRRIAWVVRWSSLAAAALVVLLVLPLLAPWFLRPIAQPDPLAPMVSAVVGDVRLGALPLHTAGERLGYGTMLQVGAQGSATLTWADGTRLTLKADSILTRLPAAGQRLKLDAGSVEVVAAKRTPEQPLEILCPDATARVVGTMFTVSVAHGQSHLAVSDGLVRWQREADGVWSLVGAGQQVAAARLPLPRPVVMSVDHLAALRTAIAAGREPWASTYAALRDEASTWLHEPIPEPTALVVPPHDGGNVQHSQARFFLHRLARPLIGLALIARVDGDAQAEAGARARLRAMTTVTLSGPDGGTLSCDMQAVFGLQAADLLRGLPSWQAEDDARIDAWIVRELQPLAEPWQRTQWMGGRWRGTAALMSIAAWRGDQATVLALMRDLRASIAQQFSAPVLARLATEPEEDQTLFQALSHALFCADVARVAGGDLMPPPAEWAQALDAYRVGLQRTDAKMPQQRGLLRALSGPPPWRTPMDGVVLDGPDGRFHTYGWYFPTLVARDPRWDAGSL